MQDRLEHMEATLCVEKAASLDISYRVFPDTPVYFHQRHSLTQIRGGSELKECCQRKHEQKEPSIL